MEPAYLVDARRLTELARAATLADMHRPRALRFAVTGLLLAGGLTGGSLGCKPPHTNTGPQQPEPAPDATAGAPTEDIPAETPPEQPAPDDSTPAPLPPEPPGR
jgi:hypothetical protein